MTWTRPWIKLWVEMLSDPKILSLTESQRWIWCALLLLTTRSPEPGRLLLPSGRPMTVKQMWTFSSPSEITADDFQEAVDLFSSLSMVAWEGASLTITNWHRRQDVQGSAERMRRLRERRRSGDGRRDDVTQPHVTGSDVVTEGVTEGVAAGDPQPAGDDRSSSAAASLESDGVTGKSVTPRAGARGRGVGLRPTRGIEEREGEEDKEGVESFSGAGAPATPSRSPPPPSVDSRGEPNASNVLKEIESLWGQPIIHKAKETKEIKAAITSGYTPDQIVACYKASQARGRWKGQWYPMSYLVEDLGEFVKTGAVKKWETGGRGQTPAPRGQEDQSEQGHSRRKRF